MVGGQPEGVAYLSAGLCWDRLQPSVAQHWTHGSAGTEEWLVVFTAEDNLDLMLTELEKGKL